VNVSVCAALCALAGAAGSYSAPVVPGTTAAAAAMMDRRTLMMSSLDHCRMRLTGLSCAL
jgi:hypothetical protein